MHNDIEEILKIAQKQSIEKYEKIVEYASKQPPLSEVDEVIMYNYISTNWHADTCPYCGMEPKYSNKKCILFINRKNFLCPLFNINKINSSAFGNVECCNGLN